MAKILEKHSISFVLSTHIPVLEQIVTTGNLFFQKSQPTQQYPERSFASRVESNQRPSQRTNSPAAHTAISKCRSLRDKNIYKTTYFSKSDHMLKKITWKNM